MPGERNGGRRYREVDGAEKEREREREENSGCAISHLQKPGWQPVPRAPIAHLLERLTRLL